MGHLLLPLFLASLDVISTALAFFGALLLRFESMVPDSYFSILARQLPVFVILTILFNVLFKFYNRLWRYAGSGELLSGAGAVICSTISWYLYSLLRGATLPRSIYIIAGILLCVLLGLSRLSLRAYGYFSTRLHFVTRFSKNLNLKKTLIIGANDVGVALAREIERAHDGDKVVLGFIDDDHSKIGKQIYGIKVLGDVASLKDHIIKLKIDKVIVATPRIKGETLGKLMELCKSIGCQLKILPETYKLVDGAVSVNQLHDVEIEDLLGRETVKLNTAKIAAYLKDKVILVTGAGGSIGSEICRQLVRMQPRKLLLLGKGENSIYEISQELSAAYPALQQVPIIADVRDRERIQEIMECFHPQVVFHAAAHKHVPLMEYQAIEAVKNNVLGTKTMAEEAAAHRVETFVMISTDKAVNPTSVMGCTKRVAEMFVQSMNNCGKTRFVAVRFGNVLGSRGSVIPLFKKQIAKGGPVTVTHPDMKRYFMTIPEASQLVLQAGAMAKGGEVFVLDMGEPVKICDLAKTMISLSNLTLNKDIEIKYTGLRPGEKLFEELLSAEDGTNETSHEKIFAAKIKDVSKEQMDQWINELLTLTDDEDIVDMLCQIVPTYKPNRIKANKLVL